MKVENFNGVPNQFIITGDDGSLTFQSYDTVIAVKKAGKVTLDEEKWDFSTTTGKYRNMFLGEKRPETFKKIKSGEYTLSNLNP